MSSNVIAFPPRSDAGPHLPGYAEAEQIVERLGPAIALHVAEYIILVALMATRTKTPSGRTRAASVMLAQFSLQVRDVVRHLARLYDLRVENRRAFNVLEREARDERRAKAEAATPPKPKKPRKRRRAKPQLVKGGSRG